MILSRRNFLLGATATIIAAPMIARADLLMPIKPTLWTPPWAVGQMVWDGDQAIGVWNGRKIITNISSAGEATDFLTPIERYADASTRGWQPLRHAPFMGDGEEKVTLTTGPKPGSEKRQQEFLERYKRTQLETVADDDLDIAFSPREMADLKRMHKNIRDTPRYSGGPFGLEAVKKLWGHS